MSELSQFALVYQTLGYSPGSLPGHPAAKVTYISRMALRTEADSDKLLALNSHPLMLARGHSIELVS